MPQTVPDELPPAPLPEPVQAGAASAGVVPRTEFDYDSPRDLLVPRIRTSVLVLFLVLLFVFLVFGEYVWFSGNTGIGVSPDIGTELLLLAGWLVFGISVARAERNFKAAWPRPVKKQPVAGGYVVTDPEIESDEREKRREAALTRRSVKRLNRYALSFCWEDATAETFAATVAFFGAVFAWFVSVAGTAGFTGDFAGTYAGLFVAAAPLLSWLITAKPRQQAFGSGAMVGRPPRQAWQTGVGAALAAVGIALSAGLALGGPSLRAAFIVGPLVLVLSLAGVIGADEGLVELAGISVIAVVASSLIVPGAGSGDPYAAVSLALAIVGVAATAIARRRHGRFMARVKREPGRLVEAAVAQLSDTHPARREAASFTLSRIVDIRSVAPLAWMLRDPDGNVARRAAISLYELRRKRLPEELIYRALSVAGYQPGDTVPGSAWKEAGSVAGYRWQLMMTFEFRRLLEDVTATQRLVEAADPDSLLAVFRWAAVVLAEGRSRQGVDHLMTLLTHERESVRTWVAGILNVAGPYATQRCLAVLDSDDGTHSDWERVGAARALVEQVRNARAWIEHGLAKDPAFGSLRGPGDDDVAGELAYLSDVVPPVLKRLADDRVSEVRRIAEEGLALFGLAQALRTDDAQ